MFEKKTHKSVKFQNDHYNLWEEALESRAHHYVNLEEGIASISRCKVANSAHIIYQDRHCLKEEGLFPPRI